MHKYRSAVRGRLPVYMNIHGCMFTGIYYWNIHFHHVFWLTSQYSVRVLYFMQKHWIFWACKLQNYSTQPGGCLAQNSAENKPPSSAVWFLFSVRFRAQIFFPLRLLWDLLWENPVHFDTKQQGTFFYLFFYVWYCLRPPRRPWRTVATPVTTNEDPIRQINRAIEGQFESKCLAKFSQHIISEQLNTRANLPLTRWSQTQQHTCTSECGSPCSLWTSTWSVRWCEPGKDDEILCIKPV